jgi:hypothetical protein
MRVSVNILTFCAKTDYLGFMEGNREYLSICLREKWGSEVREGIAKIKKSEVRGQRSEVGEQKGRRRMPRLNAFRCCCRKFDRAGHFFAR